MLYFVNLLTVKRIPQEHLASLQSTANLVHPRIIKGHPLGLVRTQSAWLDVVPLLVLRGGRSEPTYCKYDSINSPVDRNLPLDRVE